VIGQAGQLRLGVRGLVAVPFFVFGCFPFRHAGNAFLYYVRQTWM